MIDIRNLRKEYEDNVALENLTLRIPRGEVYGLIGPNGAGKTTLIRILATLLEPTYGTVFIGGIDALRQPLKVRPLLGYMSDFFSLYENMLVWEYLDHFARCYGVASRQRSRLIDDVLELVSLEVRREAEIRTLSRGMRQRLCFAKGLLHEPEVLLLDEPASGLDPAGRIEFRELVKRLRQMGRTILISSHILTEMADYCTAVAILEKGRIVADGRVDDIVARLQSDTRLEVEVARDSERLAAWLEGLPGVSNITRDGETIRCHWTHPREHLPGLHRQIVEQGIPLISFSARRDSLEDVYMKISRHETS